MLQQRINHPRRRYRVQSTDVLRGNSCGCAMGARFLAMALIVSSAWYGWSWFSGSIGAGGVVLRIFLSGLLASTLGKIVGLVIYHRRSSDIRIKQLSAK